MDWIEARAGSAQLEAGEVHVWRFPLAGADASDTLRVLLSGYTGTPPRELEFAREQHGKPVLAPRDRNLEFNISHSGDWGLIVVAQVPVGVDVEQVRPQRPTAALAQRFLTDGERELVRLRSAQHGETAFFIAWSRKEAYLKGAGFGLAAPFSRVDSSLDRLPDLDEQGVQLTGDASWSVREFFVDDRHPAAVVARMTQLDPRFLTFTREDP